VPDPIAPGIPATHPTVLPAAPERIYDRWAISEIFIGGTGIGNDPASGHVRWRKYRQVDGTGAELAPPDDLLTMPLGDLYALAAQFPEVATALAAFVAAAVKVGVARGIL
jgi:hypothetical protein